MSLKGRIKNVAELRSRTLTAWEELDQLVIDTAVSKCQSVAHARVFVRVLKRKAVTFNTNRASNCIGLPIHCNYHVGHYSGFSRISPSILDRFTPNLQA